MDLPNWQRETRYLEKVIRQCARMAENHRRSAETAKTPGVRRLYLRRSERELLLKADRERELTALLADQSGVDYSYVALSITASVAS
ncbi:hypothetical protein HMF7854_11130 [Sphingomonas ginkgonis]|uniref:Uncharacterized protein n=1 Tax=Sphingomonas ginkgonis TaxID=2315330 RepID=A0A3R9WPJ3_9SPHN|nr:hypothetical protein [Sphingomonas ginkgonis]RST31329.1 hypothetical protein HMF7854_11130 [Sphingomonas ginkgonis]